VSRLERRKFHDRKNIYLQIPAYRRWREALWRIGFGFLLAGKEGSVNMVSWGLALGFLGSISMGFAMIVGAHFWTGYLQRFGKESFKKISEGEEDEPDY